jgi:hypothetical protein
MHEPESVDASSSADPVKVLKLQAQRKSGVGWFYAIAAFSVINLIILASGGGVNFVIGLGVTQIVDVLGIVLSEKLSPNAAATFRIIGGAVTVSVAGIFVLFGVLANRGHTWAFVIGVTLYALDGLLFLWLQDWLSFGFHVFAILMLLKGLSAQIQLGRLQQPNRAPPPSADPLQ